MMLRLVSKTKVHGAISDEAKIPPNPFGHTDHERGTSVPAVTSDLPEGKGSYDTPQERSGSTVHSTSKTSAISYFQSVRGACLRVSRERQTQKFERRSSIR
mgnify:CR=1 FL=1